MKTRKVIIDTDPGIDDALAIMMAVACPEVELLGLTTSFGNVPTSLATTNALALLERCGCENVPVVAGADGPLSGSTCKRIADFVHGKDGFGETYLPPPTTTALQGVTAAEFIVGQCRKYPGEVTVLAIAGLTNLALAFQSAPEELDGLLAEVVFMGGAFRINGNVNPAAEANAFADADAADLVMSVCTKARVVPLDATHTCVLTKDDLDGLQGPHGAFVRSIAQFYLAFHQRTYSRDIVMLHDPAAMAVMLDHSFITEWCSGPVVVGTEGAMKGHTILDFGTKIWVGDNNPWLQRPKVAVGLQVDGERVRQRVLQLLSAV